MISKKRVLIKEHLTVTKEEDIYTISDDLSSSSIVIFQEEAEFLIEALKELLVTDSK